jgi:hypothetical protein
MIRYDESQSVTPTWTGSSEVIPASTLPLYPVDIFAFTLLSRYCEQGCTPMEATVDQNIYASP